MERRATLAAVLSTPDPALISTTGDIAALVGATGVVALPEAHLPLLTDSHGGVQGEVVQALTELALAGCLDTAGLAALAQVLLPLLPPPMAIGTCGGR